MVDHGAARPERNPAAIATLDVALPYIESWIAYRVWRDRIPGAQYAIRYDGRLQTSGAVGLADLKENVRMSTKHLFPIASHSKMFTSTVILQLVEQGRMRLDAELCEYVEELTGTPAGERSIRELLEHTGGIVRDGNDGDYWQQNSALPGEEEFLEMVRDHGVKSPQNARFDYSNVGYGLLGIAIERVVGRSWGNAVKTQIIEPLGLNDTYPDLTQDLKSALATGYAGVHAFLDRRQIPHVETRVYAAAGGVISTAEETAEFVEALRVGDRRLMTDRSKRAMQRPNSANPEIRDSGTAYALGMMVEQVGGRTLLGHSGGYPGHITWTMLDPADEIVVSVLTNSTDGPADEIGAGVFKLLELALKSSDRGSPTSAPSAPLGDTQHFEGRFVNIWGIKDIVRLGDRLISLSPEQSDPLAGMDELEVIDEHTLQISGGSGYGSAGELIHFNFAADGRVESIRGEFGMTAWAFDLDGEESTLPPPAAEWMSPIRTTRGAPWKWKR